MFARCANGAHTRSSLNCTTSYPAARNGSTI
jgi:hypothetical protein